jgi:hypothetical protein
MRHSGVALQWLAVWRPRQRVHALHQRTSHSTRAIADDQ